MVRQAQTNDKQTALILFGSTGDLALGKLIPSLFSLYKNNLLEQQTFIVCVGRKHHTSDSYRDSIFGYFKEHHNLVSREHKKFKMFLSRLIYVSGDPVVEKTYEAILSELKNVFPRGKINTSAYLAVPQEVHTSIVELLKSQIFSKKKYHCRYIAIEKPFGYNKQTAKNLHKELTKHISEAHLVFLDHYLYKEPITEFEKLLRGSDPHIDRNKFSKGNIKSIHAMLEETKKVEHRLDFYSKVGALRDVGQNHVLQMLLSVLSFGGKTKEKIYHAKMLSVSDETTPVFKRYRGYKGSIQSETYFRAQLESRSSLWRGARLCISGGKGLKHNKSGVEIVFSDKTKYFVDANLLRKNSGGAYDALLRDLLYKTPLGVSIQEIISSWRICEEILKKK